MAKIPQPKIERAIQVAAQLATGIATNGAMAEDKQLQQCCFTALRLVLSMDAVVDAFENDDALAESPLLGGKAYVDLKESLQRRKDAKATKEEAKDGSKTETPKA